MRTADGKRFRELLRAMNRVLACESGAELDNPMLDVYWLALSDWSLEEFDQACTHLLKTATFMPKPAAFTALRKAAGNTAGEAWARALEHARNLPASGGYLQETRSGDALLDAAARTVGGFKAIANASERDLQFIAQRFDEHYAALLEREDVGEAMPLLDVESLYNNPRRLA
jgi:uncharacterized protein YllA (UPF0747 family)